MPQKKPQTWIPMILALSFPFLAFLGILLLSDNFNPQQEGGDGVEDVYVGTANISVRLVTEEGSPIVDRVVTFLSQVGPNSSENKEITTRTDTAGYATTSLLRKGTVIVRIANSNVRHEFNQLDLAANDAFNVTLVVGEDN